MDTALAQPTSLAELDPKMAECVADTLRLFTAPSRLLILARLRRSSATVNDLVEATGMQQPAISHQLKLMHAMGIVVRERAGRQVVYSFYDDRVAGLLEEAVHHAAQLAR